MTPENQRRHPRMEARIPAWAELAWGALEGNIENIAEGGAFFVTDTLEGAVDVGERVEMRFRDPDSAEEVRLAGSVLRLERYFHEGEVFRAFAVRFDEPYEAARPADD